MKASKRTSTFEEISKEHTVLHQHRSKTIGKMEMTIIGDRATIMGVAIKTEAVGEEVVVAVMEVIITTRVDGIMVLEKAGMVITEEEEVEDHEEATSLLTM